MPTPPPGLSVAVPELKHLNTRALIEKRNSIPPVQRDADSFATLGSSPSLVFAGRPVLFILSVTLHAVTLAAAVELAVRIDNGPDVVAAYKQIDAVAQHQTVNGVVVATPTEGQHVIHLRWRRAGGTGTLEIDSNDQCLLYSVEL